MSNLEDFHCGGSFLNANLERVGIVLGDASSLVHVAMKPGYLARALKVSGLREQPWS